MHRLDQISAKKPAKLLNSKSLTLDFSRQQIWPVFLPISLIWSWANPGRPPLVNGGGAVESLHTSSLAFASSKAVSGPYAGSLERWAVRNVGLGIIATPS